MKKTILKTSIITLTACLLVSCAEMSENQRRHEAEEAAYQLQIEAQEDAINVERFKSLSICENFWSPRAWKKVYFDPRQGYCILIPVPKQKSEKINVKKLKK